MRSFTNAIQTLTKLVVSECIVKTEHLDNLTIKVTLTTVLENGLAKRLVLMATKGQYMVILPWLAIQSDRLAAGKEVDDTINPLLVMWVVPQDDNSSIYVTDECYKLRGSLAEKRVSQIDRMFLGKS